MLISSMQNRPTCLGTVVFGGTLGEFATVSWWLPLSLGDEAVWSFREQMHMEINTGEWSSSVHLHSALCKKKKRNWHSHPGIVWGSTLVNFHVTETAKNKDVFVVHPSQLASTRTLDSMCLRSCTAHRWTPGGSLLAYISIHVCVAWRLHHKD